MGRTFLEKASSSHFDHSFEPGGVHAYCTYHVVVVEELVVVAIAIGVLPW
jgi:hypothetical protein